jgi:RecQ family ATP-dependent DNA helicase
MDEAGQMSLGPSPGERADALLGELGYAEWRAGQREAVIAALEGRDSLIVMPTGGGKSLCYQLPGLASDDLTIVVSPLIALMRDQWLRLTQAGQPVVMVSSAMGEEESRAALESVRDGRAKIVYCAPERFASSFFLDAIGRRKVDLLAVDEAHCVSEWGHDFRPDYLRLPQVAERLGRPTVMACTATATVPVAVEIAQRFNMREPLRVRAGFEGAPPGPARGRPGRPGEPARDRLLRHPQGHRRGRRRAARDRAAGARLPRRDGR